MREYRIQGEAKGGRVGRGSVRAVARDVIRTTAPPALGHAPRRAAARAEPRPTPSPLPYRSVSPYRFALPSAKRLEISAQPPKIPALAFLRRREKKDADPIDYC